ncbi:hypothetical protein GYB22_04290 [bacterium]|nr:hypothetical protein [bacterium]
MNNKILAIALILILSSCTSILEKKLNKDDFDEVKQEIKADETYSEKKKQYLIDQLDMQLGFAEIGKALEIDESNLPTFQEQINELSTEYDSIRQVKLEIRENNKKLENFVTLVDASSAGIDKYKGYLSMTLNFTNPFDKEILYVILNYKYINKYDTEFFSANTKLTDEVAGDFKGEIEISTKEEYNDVANFIYTEIPVQASKAKRDEFGKEKADEKVNREFLMNGLDVSVLGIVFKDKSELTYQDAEWKYLESE